MNEIRAPGAASRLPAPEQASPRSPISNVIQAGTEPRMTARDVLVQIFYYGPLLRNCILLGVFVGLLAATLTPTEYTADSLALVLIGSESTSAQNSSGITPTVLSIDGLKAVQSEIQIAESDEVLRTTVRRVGAGVIYPWLVHGPVGSAYCRRESLRPWRDLRSNGCGRICVWNPTPEAT